MYIHVCAYMYVHTHAHPPPAACSQEHPPKPDVPWLSLAQWSTCCDLEDLLPAFKGITSDIVSTPVHCKAGRVEVSPSSSLLLSPLTLSPLSSVLVALIPKLMVQKKSSSLNWLHTVFDYVLSVHGTIIVLFKTH